MIIVPLHLLSKSTLPVTTIFFEYEPSAARKINSSLRNISFYYRYGILVSLPQNEQRF